MSALRAFSPPDPDKVLIAELLAPPPLEDCRRAVEFWQRRLATLPRRRLAARREARMLAARWEARLRAAEAAAEPAPVRILRSVGRVLRRTAIAVTAVVLASILTFWLTFMVALVVLLS